jgi:hypothetical protein
MRGVAMLAMVVLVIAGPAAGFASAQTSPWITGYYSALQSILSPDNIAWNKYTHVVHFAATTDGNGIFDWYYIGQNTTYWGGSTAEVSSLINTAHKNNVKVLLCIKDNDNNYGDFPSSTSSTYVNTFVANIAAAVSNPLGLNPNGSSGIAYDGVDIDWEKQVNEQQFDNFLVLLRQALGPNAIITMAANYNSAPVAVDATANPQYQRVTFNAGTSSAITVPTLNQVNVMCYDEDWGSSYAWYVDPLFRDGNGNVNTCEGEIATKFASANPVQIGIGMPFYVRRWAGAIKALQKASWGRTSSPNYRDLVTDPTRWPGADPTQGHDKFYDPVYKANYLTLPNLNEFDSYPDYQFIDDLVQWVHRRGFGGYMTYNIEAEYLGAYAGTDAAYPLSTEINNAIDVVYGLPTASLCHGGWGGCLSLGPAILPPVSSSVTSNSATITWSTDEYAGAQVYYGTTSAYGLQSAVIAAAPGVTRYSVPLSGLKRNTTYHYQVVSTDPNTGVSTHSGDLTFTTSR